MKLTRRRWLAIYLSWILVCAIAAALAGRAEDPSRRSGRIAQRAAAAKALEVLRERDPARYRGYEVVHIAWARAGEGGPVARWVVLCDSVPHSALRDAVVVEIDGTSGTPLGTRAAR